MYVNYNNNYPFISKRSIIYFKQKVGAKESLKNPKNIEPLEEDISSDIVLLSLIGVMPLLSNRSI